MSIANWPISERPREKLLHHGPSVLSDAELLAIFLRTGCAGKSAVDLARELLQEYGGLRPLMEASQADFCRGLGLGSAKYAQLQAVLEMARRHLSATMKQGDLLANPHLVRQYLSAQLRHQHQEIFAVLFLDSQNRLIAYDEIFFGTIDGASVYPREVVKKALARHAAVAILVHNHPSGNAEPSQADHQLTTELQKVLGLVGVKVVDHMIVGENEVVSLAERGLI
jgi:DNA repair protein RadC